MGSEQLVEAAGEPKLFLISVMMQCQVQDRWILEPKSAAELREVIVKGLINVDGEDHEISEIRLKGGS